MPIFEGQFISIVFIGKQNPQVLNHDFLLSKGILPKDQNPFKDLFAAQDRQPFTTFVATPNFATITYGPICIAVESNRYQITDNDFKEPPLSPIIQITKKYSETLLQDTPPQVGGVNLNGIIKFTDDSDEQVLDERMGISKEHLSKIISSPNVRIALNFHFPWHKGIVDIQLPKLKGSPRLGAINLNYEFKNPDANLNGFLKNLDDFPEVYRKFTALLKSLDIGGGS